MSKATKQYILLDSAGIRRKGQREFGAENFAVFKTIQTAYQSDIICLVVDGSQPLSHQDQVVAGIAKEANRSIIVVANKSDLVDLQGKKEFERQFYRRFFFLNNPHTFEMLLKSKSSIDRNYIKFLENFLRRQFQLYRSGIKIVLTEVEKKQVLS